MRLITPYPKNKKVDQILEALAEDFYHDDVHALTNGDDATAVADSDQDASDSSTDGGDAMICHGADEAAQSSAVDTIEQAELSAEQADEIQKVKSTIDALQATIETLQKIGQVSAVQSAQLQLDKERRKMRKLSQESPAVVESSARLRQAVDQESPRARRLADQHREQQKSIAKAIGDKKPQSQSLSRRNEKFKTWKASALRGMLSKPSHWRHSARAVPTQAGPRAKKTATKYLTAFLAFERASLLVRRTIGNGSRKPGTKKWSNCMVRVGRNFLRPGCRRR
jgi:hypothetical protein